MLAYCIVEQQSRVDIPLCGVEGARVNSLHAGLLRCFVSDFRSGAPDVPVPEMVTAFNRVLQLIFSQTTIIPFRFPTIVQSGDVLRQFLEDRSAQYSNALHRLRDKVQVDVRITLKPGSAPKFPPDSGRSYLDQRRERYQQVQSTLAEFRRVSDSLAEEWKERDTSSGIRAFALMDRSSLPVFVEKIAQVHTHSAITARVTGPWPPSEFVEIVHE